MIEEIRKLKEKTDTQDSLDRQFKALQKKFEDSTKELKERLDEAKKQVNQQKDVVEKEVLAQYARSKETKYPGGLGIRVYKTPTYSPDEALEWAKEKKMFLKLDTKAFEKAAGGMDLDFVKIEDVPKMTVPSKGIVIEEDAGPVSDELSFD
jgi:hypothetical protein